MAFTETDLANVEAAIVGLQTGTRAVQVMSGDKSVRYQESQLKDLLSLRTTIMHELGMISFRTYAGQGGRSL